MRLPTKGKDLLHPVVRLPLVLAGSAVAVAEVVAANIAVCCPEKSATTGLSWY